MVCRALAINYKQFSSGAPDLLLIRVKRRRKDAVNIGDSAHDYGGDSAHDYGDDGERDDGSHAGCYNHCHDTVGNDNGSDKSDGYDVVNMSEWIENLVHDQHSPGGGGGGGGGIGIRHRTDTILGEPAHDKVSSSSSLSSLLNDEDYHYLFESMYIEVKGPTDHLSFKQRVWLHLLNSGGDGDGGCDGMRSFPVSIPKAFVCQIEE